MENKLWQKKVSAGRRIHFTIQSWQGYKRRSSVLNMMCFFTKMAKRLRTRCFFITHGGIATEGLALGEPEAKSYEKAKENLKKAVMEIKEHKKRRWK